MGLRLINKYEGTRKKQLAQRDLWWLLDRRSFVDLVRYLGYTSVRFRESSEVNRQAGDSKAATIMILDTSKTLLKNSHNDRISTIGSLGTSSIIEHNF